MRNSWGNNIRRDFRKYILRTSLLKIYISGELKKQIDILSAENIKRSNIFSRLFQSLNYLVWGDA